LIGAAHALQDAERALSENSLSENSPSERTASF
jgi:hypothetical protein